MQPNPTRLATLAAIAALTLSGCAGMGKNECRAIDWRTVGYEDGATGQAIGRLTSRRQACAKHGVAPDLDAYLAGRDEGLLEFCRPANGFRVGARGRDYAGICPAHLDLAFTDAYQAGRTLWQLETRVRDTARGIVNRRAQVEEIDTALLGIGYTIIGENRTPEERAQALLDTRSLTDRRGRLLVEMEALELVLPGYEAELEEYRLVLAEAGY